MTYTPFYFFFFNYYRSDVSVSFARGVLCPAPPLPEFPSMVFCAREFRERVKFRSLRRMVSDNSESECFGTRFLSMSIPRHCMPFFFLTLFLAAGLYPAFFFYSLGCHPSHFHSHIHTKLWLIVFKIKMRNTIVIFFATKSEPWPAFCTIIFIIYLFRLTC